MVSLVGNQRTKGNSKMFYQEINILEQEEVPSHAVMAQVYSKIHIALAELNNRLNVVPVGLSFPEYDYQPNRGKHQNTVGKKIRLIAKDKECLTNLNITKYLCRLFDYITLSSIQSVPVGITNFSIYKRKQVKSNAATLARRIVNKTGVEESIALEKAKNSLTFTDLPYVCLSSYSTSANVSNNRFTLHIEKLRADSETAFVFSTYGLSSLSALPDF